LAQVSKIDDYRQQKAGQPARSPMERLLADARLRLVETGTRNRLVHTPRGGKRTRSVGIVGADADGLFETLVRSNRAMGFVPANAERELALEIQYVNRSPSADVGGLSLRTNLDEQKLEKRLLSIYRDAKTAEEEQGINILFLAIGFLRWYEDEQSDVPREAPLILVPVSLTRDLRRSTFQLRSRDEDIATNQAIQERLRSDFGVALPDVPDGEDWCPTDYFSTVSHTIASKSRWSIDADAVELGFYSFSKLLMIRDLEPGAWGEKSVLDHPLLRGLLTDGFTEEPSPFAQDAALDELFAPSDLVQVVDADSSQTIVIETIRSGRNLVVQGPPGTGKSQTIANIIAAAVHDGKSVLFVAEKMAALNVVHHRLHRVGLGSICLQLHSRSANKRLVLAELDETLNRHAAALDAQVETERLQELRDTLNAADRRMHTPVGEMGMTPFLALSRLVAAGNASVVSDPDLLVEAATWSKSQHAAVVQAARELSEITETAGPYFQHPYFGVHATSLQPAELVRMTPSLATLAMAASELASNVEAIANFVGIEHAASLSVCSSLVAILEIIAAIPSVAAEIVATISGQNPRRILEASKIGLAWADLKTAHSDTFVDAAWNTPAAPLRVSLAAGLSFFGRFKSSYRRASKVLATLIKVPLPRSAQNRLALVDTLITIESARERLKAEDAVIGAMLPAHWHGPNTDFAMLHTVSSALHQLASQPPAPRVDSVVEIARLGLAQDYIAGLKRLSEAFTRTADTVLPMLKVQVSETFQAEGRDQIPLRNLARHAQGWRDSQSRFDEWRRLFAADARVRAQHATAIANGLAAGRMSPVSVKSVLDCTFAETVWHKAIASVPELGQFYGPSHDAIADEFRGVEARRRRTTVQIVCGRHAEKIPRGNYGAMNVIRSEIKRKRGHMPLRKLFKTTGETLQRIKPVLLMSPISVAQFLPPGSVEFDLLVIDEASQVRPEDALGLVARAKQMVVVGDNKQLPPTSFFDRVIADEEEADPDETTEAALGPAAKATELESILALCEARGLNSAMLRWHYRSRHPSLIEVSNAEFYKRLIMPPAPVTGRGSEGLILHRVAGAYDRGGKRHNLIEAEAVANAVAAHARSSPGLSLGIATFSSAQRDAIEDVLEIKRRSDDALDELLREGKDEDVFLKNLENVQGDERDVIFVSVGYGPRIAGARLDSMAFGPVSADGGERRLNVLFTRARSRCEIFVSFAAGDIDLDRAKGEGPRVLKRFLQYAESGQLEERGSTSEDTDSPFEETVAAFIEGLGYKVDKQVGSTGFKIDLAVRHPDYPGRYMLAIECDGATYHSGLWARERDRLRQEILENMGWRFCRIWSTDWFYRRAEAAQKLRAALEIASSTDPRPLQPEPPSAVIACKLNEPAASPPQANVSDLHMPPYELAEGIPVPANLEPHQVAVTVMARIIEAIVNIEGPVHQDEVARRVTSLFGKSRTGSLISAAALRSLRTLKASRTLIERNDFWMTQAQLDNPPARDRSGAPLTLQRADMLSPLEIRAAIKVAERENGAMSADDVAIAVTRLLGFKRTGPDLRAAIRKAVQM
jgi:very-short-patch-repair endonuclease